MIGRGGGAMSVRLAFNAAKGAGWYVQVTFARASQPGASGNLRPGECAWADRPLTADEPNALLLSSSTRWYPTCLDFDAHTRRLTDITFAGDFEAAKNLFQWATTENQQFYVHCFNPPWARGVLLVTRVGP